MPSITIDGPPAHVGSQLVRARNAPETTNMPSSGDRQLDSLLAELAEDLGDGIDPVGDAVVLERRLAAQHAAPADLSLVATPADPKSGPVFGLLQLPDRSLRWVTSSRGGAFLIPPGLEHHVDLPPAGDDWQSFGVLRWFQATNKKRVDQTVSTLGTLEQTLRYQRLRTYTPANWTHTRFGVQSLGSHSPEWRNLSKGRILLFIHGTLRQCHSGFGGARRPASKLDHDIERRFGDLAGRYEDRVIAFDHLTVTEDPIDNARMLLACLPRDQNLHIDVVAQSRGVLVARLLSERWGRKHLGPAAERLTIHKAVFVGAPNRGTPLVQPRRAREFLDLHTHLAMHQPEGEATATLKLISSMARDLARQASLSALMPGGISLNARVGLVSRLNEEFGPEATDATYCGIQADYNTPSDPASVLSREVMGVANDLIVPVEGAFDIGRAGSGRSFPIEGSRALLFRPEHGVNHQTYFRQLETWQMMRRWLA